MEILQLHSSFLVTALRPAAKNQNRVNVFINDKFDFSLDLAQVVDLKIKVGQLLSEKQLNDFRKASEFGKLYQRTLEYVLSRPHSIKETRDHLKQTRKKRALLNAQAERNRERLKSETPAERQACKAREQQYGTQLKTKTLPLYSDADIEKVIAMLIEKGYLDDAKFASFYLENRFVKKGISRRRLEQELVKKGIAPELIEQALKSSSRNESAEIQKVIAKKRRKYDDEQLLSYLVRQGFDYQQSRALLAETDSQN